MGAVFCAVLLVLFSGVNVASAIQTHSPYANGQLHNLPKAERDSSYDSFIEERVRLLKKGHDVHQETLRPNTISRDTYENDPVLLHLKTFVNMRSNPSPNPNHKNGGGAEEVRFAQAKAKAQAKEGVCVIYNMWMSCSLSLSLSLSLSWGFCCCLFLLSPSNSLSPLHLSLSFSLSPPSL